MKNLIVIILAIVIASCGSKNQKTNELKVIEDEHKAFYDSLQGSNFDFEKVKILSEKYETFIAQYPNDTIIPKLKIDLAGLYLNFLGEQQKAIDCYVSIHKEFEKSEYAPIGLFAAATIYQDRIKDIDAATNYYELILEKYPDHHLVADVDKLLKNINLTEEELLELILKEKLSDSNVTKVDTVL